MHRQLPWKTTNTAVIAEVFAYAQLLAAIGRDKLIPQLAMFYPGENQEPRKGLALIYVGSSCIIMIGALNAVAPFITTWFLT